MKIPYFSRSQERIDNYVKRYRTVANEVLTEHALNIRLFGAGRAAVAASVGLAIGASLEFKLPDNPLGWAVAGLGALGVLHEARHVAVVVPEQGEAISMVMEEQVQARYAT